MAPDVTLARQLIVVMGPSGAGKSRIGAALATALAAPFYEGDDFHPSANREKMARGSALSDDDREDWIDAIVAALSHEQAPMAVLACSALTPYVQDRLRQCASHKARFVLLEAPRSVLAERVSRRRNHFMPVSLLDTQLEALEKPLDAIPIDAREPVAAIIAHIVEQLDNQSQCKNNQETRYTDKG